MWFEVRAEEEDGEDQPEEQEDDTPVIKLLRQQLKQTRGAAQEAAATKRELAFLKAGVDVDSKAGKLLLKAYEGDLSDIEALRTEAQELGALKSGTPVEGQTAGEPPAAPPSTGSADRNAVAGGEPLDPNQKKPVELEAREAFEESIKRQKSQEDALVDWFGVKVNRKAEELGLKPSNG